MPNLKQRKLDRMRLRPGWENALEVSTVSGERDITLRDERGVLWTRTSKRRHSHRDGGLVDLDSDWIPIAGQQNWRVNMGSYRLRAGDRDDRGFHNNNLMRYDFGDTTLDISPIRNLVWRRRNRVDDRLALASTNSTARRVSGREDIIRWPNTYGAGFHYEIVAESDRVFKRVRVPSKADLGTHQPNEYLVLGNRIDLDNDSRLFYWDNGWTLWNGVDKITTYRPVLVRQRGEGRYVFARPFIQSSPTDRDIGPRNREIAAGRQRDPFGNIIATYSWYELWNDNGVTRMDSCFAPDMFPTTATFYLDPTLNLDVTDALSGEDNSYSGTRPNTSKNWADVQDFASGHVKAVTNWDVSASLSQGDTISAATLSVYIGGSPAADWDSDIRMEDILDSTFPTSGSECNDRYTDYHATQIGWDPGTTGGRQDTADFATLMESVLSGSGTVGELAIDIEATAGSSSTTIYTYGYGDTYDMELDVTYESGGPAAAVKDPIGVGIIPFARS